MAKWVEIVEKALELQEIIENLEIGEAEGVYHQSLLELDEHLMFLLKENSTRFLIVVGRESGFHGFEGDVEKHGDFVITKAPLSSRNAGILRRVLPWTAPKAFGSSGISIGLGDRLGLSSPGHIEVIRGVQVRPVLAQQSMRELDLTNRTYTEVLDAATWAVFQEGYQDGYGADGDHLKNIADIRNALELGFSMITLDCSEHIDEDVDNLAESSRAAQYASIPEHFRQVFEPLYKGREYVLADNTVIELDTRHYHRMVLVYYRVLEFIAQVYAELISKVDRPVDFEISIDEVATPTTPQDHYFIANELRRRGIKVSGIAPHFCGDFEKGIDYRGSVQQFEEEFATHAVIARHFGHKLSVHSGSDKFAVFPIVGKYADSGYHIKTAGTNWLEAVRVIAVVAPDLYRKMHHKALASVDVARQYYKVSLNLANIPDISQMDDQELPTLLNHDDSRQLLHITYGQILQDRPLKKSIYAILNKHELVYREFLRIHLRKHLESLGIRC